MSKSQVEPLAYLDHNVLDRLSKGNPSEFKSVLVNRNLTPVFSNENLAEIQRSKGYENTFLKLLKDIKAKHLVLKLDTEFKQTGKAELRHVDSFDAYQYYIDNTIPTPKYGYGITGMLQKYYGGLTGESFKDVQDKGINELKELLNASVNDLESCKDVNFEIRKKINQLPDQAVEALEGLNYAFPSQLDEKNDGSLYRQFENTTGIGPINLKNIKGPNIVVQIWEQVEKQLKKKFPDVGIDLETFFGLKPAPWNEQAGRKITLFEKVNALYFRLNDLGYYRDKNMKVQKRFNASFSDMTHAGMAAFCHLFYSFDKNLIMKTKAVYEHLGIQTKAYLL